jgi:hypothetical protein
MLLEKNSNSQTLIDMHDCLNLFQASLEIAQLIDDKHLIALCKG